MGEACIQYTYVFLDAREKQRPRAMIRKIGLPYYAGRLSVVARAASGLGRQPNETPLLRLNFGSI